MVRDILTSSFTKNVFFDVSNTKLGQWLLSCSDFLKVFTNEMWYKYQSSFFLFLNKGISRNTLHNGEPFGPLLLIMWSGTAKSLLQEYSQLLGGPNFSFFFSFLCYLFYIVVYAEGRISYITFKCLVICQLKWLVKYSEYLFICKCLAFQIQKFLRNFEIQGLIILSNSMFSNYHLFKVV